MRCVRESAGRRVTTADSRGGVTDARKRLCQLDVELVVDSDDDDDGGDSLLDSEVSELLRCRSPGVVDHSPCKRPRQRDRARPAVATSPAGRSPPRPSLDFYKMQVRTGAVAQLHRLDGFR